MQSTYMIHKLLTNGAAGLGQGCGEHHYLFVVRCLLENILDVPSHV